MNMLLVKMFLSVGLAMATTISAIVQTCLYIIVLNKMFGVKFYLGKFVEFLLRYILQLSVIFTLIYFVYRAIYKLIGLFTGKLPNFLLFKLGFWLWVGPICLFAFLLIYYTRKIFKVKLYFLD
jgi:peptidoglycan biosynthesis protein MviN/MurJ (putative lipid II flippase)